MKNCYIKITEKFSKIDFFLFRHIRWNRLLKKNTFTKDAFHIIQIPVSFKMKENKKKKYYTKICKYLHAIGVETICFYQIEDDLLRYYLNCEFQRVKGYDTFRTLFPRILTYFATKKGYNLNEIELCFITNHLDKAKALIMKSFKKVKGITVYTQNPMDFENFTKEFRETYGIFIHVHGKNDKVKKYNKIYINCEDNRIFDEDYFKTVNLIDIYGTYNGGYQDIIFSYKTKDDFFLKENHIVKNLMFTEFYFNYVVFHTDQHFQNEKNYKIVNIRKL